MMHPCRNPNTHLPSPRRGQVGPCPLSMMPPPPSVHAAPQHRRAEHFTEQLPRRIGDARKHTTRRLMQYVCHMRDLRGDKPRDPRQTRFAFEDRPGW
eukprot:363925-Chlamydomonas_euryale.AAC.6